MLVYDVFISFKNRDNDGNLLLDSIIAQQIYIELKNRNIEVFYSNSEIEEQGESRWRKSIDNALEEANTLILVSTSLDNLYSGQVDYEWEQIFLEKIINGEKPDGRIIGYFQGIDRNSLDTKLRNHEIFDVKERSIQQLCDFIEKRLPNRNILDSAIENQSPVEPKPINKYNKRFHYAAGYTNLFGRENEIGFLRDFCLENNSLFSWTIISGKGGIGKSKLVYDFCRIIEKDNDGWKALRPRHAKSFIKDTILSISTDTVICFDYVKFELDYVEEIMHLIIEQKIRHKVRIILIERDGIGIKNGFSSKIGEYHYKGGDLSLKPLEESALINLIKDFAAKCNDTRVITSHDINNIIETLKWVDPGMCRPLLAMFITDAWIDGKLNLLDWDRDSAVKYIASKELERFDTVISNYANGISERNQLRDALYIALAYATFIGELCFVDMLEEQTISSSVSEQTINQMLDDSDMLRDGIIKGIEPDLVGEYICISILRRLDEKNIYMFFSRLYEKHFKEMIAYFDKMYDDYTDEFLESSWSKFATNIEYPKSYNYVPNNMFSGCEFIYEIKLHSNVTTISKGAFRDCNHLKKISLPDNLEIIDSTAFMNCVSLEIVAPDDEKGWVPSVIIIRDRAFKNCRKLKEIRIPNSVKEIGTEAFAKCNSLETVAIPRDVDVIAHNAFESCISLCLVEFKNSKGKIQIQSEAFKGCSNLEFLKNSKRISSIGKSAFENCTKIKNISLGESLTYIHDSAFKGCVSLEAIDLSNTNLKKINKAVFEHCVNLFKIALPDSLSHIEARSFYRCEKLANIILPQFIKRIGELAFYGCYSLNCSSFGTNLGRVKEFCAFYVNGIDNDFIKFVASYYDEKDVNLPLNIYKLGDRAFLNNQNLEHIRFHNGIKGLGKEVFSGCVNLKKVTGSFAGVNKIGVGAFKHCKRLESLPTDVAITEIAEYSFGYCISLRELRINSQIQKIGKSAFTQCISLQKLFFKGKCNCISAGAFLGCERFYLSDKYHIKRQGKYYYICGFIFNHFGKEELNFINNYSKMDIIKIPTSCIGFFENPFENTKVKKIYIPNSVKSLIRYNFAGLLNLEYIKLPRHINAIPEGTFEGCQSLRMIEMPGTENNNLRDKLHLGQKAFSGCSSLTYIGLPKGINKLDKAVFQNCKSLELVALNKELKIIGDEAFSGCEALKSVVLPDSVEQIGYAAFEDCTEIVSVNGLENTRITTIQNETFRGCLNLRDIKLPISLKSIGAYVFYDCRRLDKIDVFNTDISYIGTATFQNCYSLLECILPKRIKKIEKFTFKSCSQLKRIKISPDIEEIETSAFFGCNMLNEIDLRNKNNLKQFGNDAFAGCHRLESIVLPTGVKNLPRGLFRGCVNIKKIEIMGSVNKIPIDCFKDCQQLEMISTTANIKTVGAGAFRNCFALKDLSFLSTVSEVGTAAFRGCIGIENANFTNIKKIPVALFMGCYNLKTIIFPQVENVDNYAFYGCRKLEDVSIEKIGSRIGAGAFWNCQNMKTPIFSDTLFDIQPSAFRNCESIEEVNLPLGVQKVYAASFRGAKNITSVSIPETTKEIHKSAFRDCERLEVVEVASEQVTIEGKAFSGCKELYYLIFNGIITAQLTAFESTPIERDLHNDSRVQWVESTARLSFSTLNNDKEITNISASKAASLFLYRLVDGGIYLEKYLGRDDIVDIPDEINGIAIEYIGDSCFEDKYNIQKIRLPETVRAIGKNAFAGCKSLNTINVPDRITSIGEYAFKWCSSLTKFNIPSGLDEIKPGLFMCCYNLRDVNLSVNIRRIDEGAFWLCKNIFLTVPNTVEYIETGAFKGIDRNQIFMDKINERYFEEWPYGEDVVSPEYGKGIIVGCEFIDKTQYSLDIEVGKKELRIIYPKDFDKTFKFISEKNQMRHTATIERISKLKSI